MVQSKRQQGGFFRERSRLAERRALLIGSTKIHGKVLKNQIIHAEVISIGGGFGVNGGTKGRPRFLGKGQDMLCPRPYLLGKLNGIRKPNFVRIYIVIPDRLTI